MNRPFDPTLPVALIVPVVFFLALWATLYFAFADLDIALKTMTQRASTRVIRSWFARWTVAHPGWSGPRSYASLALMLVLGGTAAFAAGGAFIEIAEHFRLATSWVYQTDHVVNAWFEDERHAGTTALFRAATVAGGTLSMTLVVMLTAVALIVRKQRASAVFVMVAAAGGELLNRGLKAIFERARPPTDTAIAAAQGYSFPSGHAMGSFIVLGSIAYILLRQPLRWNLKSAWLAMLVTAVVLIGMSRVYLGVHWISDIAAGWSAGGVWLATAALAFETLQRSRLLRQVPPTGTGADIPDATVQVRPTTPSDDPPQ